LLPMFGLSLGLAQSQPEVFMNKVQFDFTNAEGHLALQDWYYKADPIKSLLSFGVYAALTDSLTTQEIEAFRNLVIGKTVANENGEVVIVLDDGLLTSNGEDDNFGLMQFFLQMNHAALSSPDGQQLTYREILYSTFEKMTNVLEETGYGKKGFYWENYVPFYLIMKREQQLAGFVETLLLHTNTVIDTNIEAPIDMEDITGFEAWLSTYALPD